MEHCAAERSQSLILLKSKLRASGRSQSKSNHRIAAALDDSASNQQENEDKSKDEFVPRISDFLVSRRGQHRLQPKQSPALLPEFEAAQDVEEPAAAPSATFECGNQSVAELKQEFAELSGKIKQLDVHVRQPDELVAHARVTPTPSFPMKLKSNTKKVIQWQCDTCERECIPVREESRCLCGHRYKEHPSSVEDPRVKSPAGFRPFACTSTKCSCKAFFYVVAEGAWILRCRCKHRHTDHDPSGKPFVCKKAKCSCRGFDSPWVCNCDHPWSAHRQLRVEKRFDPLQLLQAQCTAPELNAVHRTDLAASPLDLRL